MSKTILIVDDDRDLREAFGLFLEGAGYRVRHASNGLEALILLEAEPLPDLILLDLVMPVMTGWDVYSRLREHPCLRRIPVVVSTASPDAAAPFEDNMPVLQKPADIDRLLPVIRSRLAAA